MPPAFAPMPALKVFRTAIGFHDAYVAAPSMKAALEAWGAGGNLFATGMAEQVTDAKLTKAPLAEPGKVIKVVRGTDAEHFEALGKAPVKPKRADAPAAAEPKKPARVAKPKPRPSRDKLDSAETALADAERRHNTERAALARKETALREERRRLETAQEAEQATLQSNRDRADAEYEKAMKRWRA